VARKAAFGACRTVLGHHYCDLGSCDRYSPGLTDFLAVYNCWIVIARRGAVRVASVVKDLDSQDAVYRRQTPSDQVRGVSLQIVTRARYSPTYMFEDPVVRYEGIDAFELNLRLLRTLFDITLDVHMVEVTGPSEITSRYVAWTEALSDDMSTMYTL
jgi:hypothetical protein